MSGDPRTDVTEESVDLTPGVVWTDSQLAVVRDLTARLYAAESRVRAGLALADELDQELADRGVLLDRVIRPGDRIRTALAAPLAGQHTTDEEGR